MSYEQQHPVRFVGRNLLFWLCFFQLTRLLFVFCNFSAYTSISRKELFGIFIYGTRMDISAAAWLSAVPFCLICFKTSSIVNLLLRCYAMFFIVVLSIVSISDLEIFKFWGCRMDASVIRYLKTPAEACASAGSSPVFLLFLLSIVLIAISIYVYLKFVEVTYWNSTPIKRRNIASTICVLAFIGIAGRGGLQAIPMNLSFAYFSQNDFVNQAAINESWNFFSSALNWRYYTKNPYRYLDQSEALSLCKSVFPIEARKGTFPNVTKAKRPNVIVIIWESCTADAVGPLGGCADVTPVLNDLYKEGIGFSNMYAAGDRTCRGLVAVLNGYPAQPHSQIIAMPTKTLKLPCLGKSFKDAGYSTSFYYGGDLVFDNMKIYLNQGGFSRIVGKETFPKGLPQSRWGVFDDAVFSKALADLGNEKRPFFCTILTLTSHEPFEIPTAPKFSGNDIESRFKSALYYTDSALGDFIEKLKASKFYDDTLVVITADHGVSTLSKWPRYHPNKFHIPLVIFGGAVASGADLISTVGSQQDIAATILGECNIDASEYQFSRNLFSAAHPRVAQMYYNDGFVWVSENAVFAYDNIAHKLSFQKGTVTEKDIRIAQATMQSTFQDYIEK